MRNIILAVYDNHTWKTLNVDLTSTAVLHIVRSAAGYLWAGGVNVTGKQYQIYRTKNRSIVSTRTPVDRTTVP